MANTGRKKIAPDKQKVNLCAKVTPETMAIIQEIADERMVSLSKVVDWLINTPTTLKDLENGIIVTMKSVVNNVQE